MLDLRLEPIVVQLPQRDTWLAECAHQASSITLLNKGFVIYIGIYPPKYFYLD